MKILVIENVQNIEERLAVYIHRYHNNDEVEYFTSMMHKSQEEIFNKFCSGEYDCLLFESTLSNNDQFLKLAGALVKFTDKISFNKVKIMFTSNDLDLYLSRLVTKDAAAATILKLFFEEYKVEAIEWRMYEDKSDDNQYIKKLIYRYQTIPLIIRNFSDGTFNFHYKHSPYVDPREEFRPELLIPIDNGMVIDNDSLLWNFLHDVESWLEYQQGIIEDSNTTYNDENDENLKRNKQNQIILRYLKSSIKIKQHEINIKLLQN